MADAVIRRAAEADRSALQVLWETVFGDPPELIQAFFAHFPPEASGWILFSCVGMVSGESAPALSTPFPLLEA